MRLLLPIALAACGLAAATAHAQTPLAEADVRARLASAGFTDVRDVQLDDGVWEADARRVGTRWVDVRVHPVSGKVYADRKGALDAAAVQARLTAAGYTRIKDVEFDDGIWHADATSRAGTRVDLAVDPDDGSVIVERAD